MSAVPLVAPAPSIPHILPGSLLTCPHSIRAKGRMCAYFVSVLCSHTSPGPVMYLVSASVNGVEAVDL